MTWTPSPLQRAAASAYDPHGTLPDFAAREYASYQEFRDVVREEAGDTLFAFLMIELSDAEDCEGPDDALRRVRSAVDQLEDVADALETLADEPAPGGTSGP